jgi:beta-galactosidase
VEQGGRVVADVPTPWWDEYGRVVKSGPGTPFEKIFGATVRVFEHTHNAPQRLGAIDVNGAYALLKLTRAEAAAHFDSGLPAITEAKSGRGSAAYLGMEASIKCLRPGNAAVENLIVNTALRGRRPAWSVTGAVAYRRVAPGADHYFLINDGAAAVAELKAEKEYRELDDAVTGERLGSGKLGRIALEARSGRWVRGSVR